VFLNQLRKIVLLGCAGGFVSAVCCIQLQAAPLALTADSINKAEVSEKGPRAWSPALVARAQILLDRTSFSPGEIDAKQGENFKKAIQAFADASGAPVKSGLTKDLWLKLTAADSNPAVVEYQITEDDIRGPFVPDLPSKMEEMKDLPAVPYKTAAEALAEKFHMSEELLKSLNPESSFDRAGETIWVANVGSRDAAVKASRVEIAKAAQTVRVFDAQNKMIAFYPATIGSEEKPSPSGKLKVTTIQPNPTYRYNPKYRFREIRATEPFTIKPGPNNPVGSVWIGLSAEGYGIHGTPEPSKVSKAESHGCIRLTNWDAEALAKRVAKGLPVEFVDRAGDHGDARRENGKGRAASHRRR
jgi:lipoprotein-anchoring transpeptidase ErfK/SrfK